MQMVSGALGSLGSDRHPVGSNRTRLPRPHGSTRDGPAEEGPPRSGKETREAVPIPLEPMASLERFVVGRWKAGEMEISFFFEVRRCAPCHPRDARHDRMGRACH